MVNGFYDEFAFLKFKFSPRQFIYDSTYKKSKSHVLYNFEK